jgi:hypothetical protein
MGYNNINKLKLYILIQEATKQHYEKGFNTLISVYKEIIYPKYFISYSHYRRIIAEPRLKERLREAQQQEEERKKP